MKRTKDLLEEYDWEDLDRDMEQFFLELEQEYFQKRLQTLKDLEDEQTSI